MQQVLQQAQQCMTAIDQNQLVELKTRSEQMQQNVKALCQKGERDQAQQTALAFAKEMSGSPAIQQMRKCSEIMQGLAVGLSIGMPEEQLRREHICDSKF